ncbi:MAG: carbonic anhydrase [Sulfurovum sp.]|nr:carbonic anhydrase [Sulfurovum sp.]MCB4759052.1 carbonic anhydrase [Sulfurovum sp.]MCB4762367.1 carbonic anhydrase [Sulfurovum sp.]MCB4775238.1 carbonic anhydrase [Sulfurovum sp.]MCB4779339.1 carbonic anhydrase [Sulfurovum sp.]
MDNHLKAFEAGHDNFRKVKFNANKNRFKRLVEEGQHPKALFIGCSDSRIMPAMITGSKAGDLFIIRNIGNFVAPFRPDADYHATASAIEYAVSILNVSDIIVCGHSHCGAIATLYKNIEEGPENIHTIKWLELGHAAKKVALLTHKNHPKEELLRYTEKISVIHQIDNLLTYPAVKRRVDEERLFLHGWYYDIENGEIAYYDNEDYEFKSLSQKP